MGKNNLWYEILIPFQTQVSGLDVEPIAQLISQEATVTLVRCADVVGDIRRFVDHDNKPMPISKFFEVISATEVIDWAFFWFIRSESDIAEIEAGKETQVIKVAEVTLRVSDSSDIYIYTLNNKVAESIKTAYPDATAECKPFDKLLVTY